jgi:hypothetical protein
LAFPEPALFRALRRLMGAGLVVGRGRARCVLGAVRDGVFCAPASVIDWLDTACMWGGRRAGAGAPRRAHTNHTEVPANNQTEAVQKPHVNTLPSTPRFSFDSKTNENFDLKANENENLESAAKPGTSDSNRRDAAVGRSLDSPPPTPLSSDPDLDLDPDQKSPYGRLAVDDAPPPAARSFFSSEPEPDLAAEIAGRGPVAKRTRAGSWAFGAATKRVGYGELRAWGWPPYPTAARIPVPTMPAPPMLDRVAGTDLGAQVDQLASYYRAAVEARYARKCHAFARGVGASRYAPLLRAAAAKLVEAGIAPAAWVAWCIGVWQRGARITEASTPPPVTWVFSATRVHERAGWFGRDAGSFQGRTILSDEHRQLAHTYERAMAAARLRSPTTATEAMAIFAEFFPRRSYDDLAQAARMVSDHTRADLAARAAAGEFLW